MCVQVAERSGYAHQQRGDGEGHQDHGRPLWQACRPVSIYLRGLDMHKCRLLPGSEVHQYIILIQCHGTTQISIDAVILAK